MKPIEECGKRLRTERERLGFNQVDFAAYGGVKSEAQYFYERGTRAPNLEYLLKIKEIGVDLDFVLYGDRTSSPPPCPGITESEFISVVRTFLSTFSLKPPLPKGEMDRLLSAMYRARLHSLSAGNQVDAAPILT